MQQDSTAAADPAPLPSLTPRSLQALGATQRWARFAGSALFAVALLKLIQSGLSVAHTHGLMAAGQLGHIKGVAKAAGLVVGGLIEAGLYCLAGAFALRYAVRLDNVRPPWQPGPHDIARALGAQHSYWRLQGILTLIGIGLLVLGIVLIVVGLMVRVAAH